MQLGIPRAGPKQLGPQPLPRLLERAASKVAGFTAFDPSPGALPLLNVISVAFVAHYNGAAYYAALRERTAGRFSAAAALALAGNVTVM